MYPCESALLHKGSGQPCGASTCSVCGSLIRTAVLMALLVHRVIEV